jgi:hypothetical protein
MEVNHVEGLARSRLDQLGANAAAACLTARCVTLQAGNLAVTAWYTHSHRAVRCPPLGEGIPAGGTSQPHAGADSGSLSSRSWAASDDDLTDDDGAHFMARAQGCHSPTQLVATSTACDHLP